MTRRSDTLFSQEWIARLGGAGALGLLTALAVTGAAQAQVLGDVTPGTPGALSGEFRTRPLALQPPRRDNTLRPPDPEQEGEATARSKLGLRRTPNTTVKRQLASGQTRTGGFAGASPTGGAGGATMAPAPRSPEMLSGARFSNTAPRAITGTAPPPQRPSTPQTIAPGLVSRATPPQRRAPAEDDPYAPLGLRSGGMIFRPGIEVDGGYDTNPGRASTNKKGSSFYRTEATLDAVSDWSTHRLDVALRGAYTGYSSLSSANRPEGDARIALRLDATRDLTIETGLTARLDTELASSVNLPGGATSRTPYYSYGGTLGATQRIGYASLNLRTSIDRFDYADVTTSAGSSSQQARNYTAYGLRLRGAYEVTPGISPFIEAGTDRRTHDLRRDTNGYARDSSGFTARIGSTVELARNLTGEASVGYTIRAYEDARLKSMAAPLVAGALTWSISPLTTLNLRAESDIAETTVAGSAGSRTYRGTATLTHAFLRNFTGTATLGLARSDYEGFNRQETSLTAGMKLEYKFNRAVAVRGSYTFEQLHANTAGSNYNSHAVMMGLRYTP